MEIYFRLTLLDFWCIWPFLMQLPLAWSWVYQTSNSSFHNLVFGYDASAKVNVF